MGNLELGRRMDDKTNAQTVGEREIVESLDREFARLHLRSCELIENTLVDTLYSGTTAKVKGSVPSVGESVLRCAAAIEQTFGGITSNLVTTAGS